MIRCDHPNAVPVESSGEVVAALCPTCDVQLTAEWLTCDHRNAYTSSVDITSLAAPARTETLQWVRRRLLAATSPDHPLDGQHVVTHDSGTDPLGPSRSISIPLDVTRGT